MKRPLAAICEARTPVCTHRAHHRHHVILRSQGGHDGPTIDVCSPCHRYIHANPAEAYEQGWLKHAWERTA